MKQFSYQNNGLMYWRLQMSPSYVQCLQTHLMLFKILKDKHTMSASVSVGAILHAYTCGDSNIGYQFQWGNFDAIFFFYRNSSLHFPYFQLQSTFLLQSIIAL